jgi:hypothetical protein
MAVDATDPASGPRLIFHPVLAPEPVKNRLRPILLTDRYGEETERLTGLGAKPDDDGGDEVPSWARGVSR